MPSGKGKIWGLVGAIVATLVVGGGLVVFCLKGADSAARGNAIRDGGSKSVANDGFKSPLDPRLSPTNVIVTINGKAITVADYDDFCRLQASLAEIKSRSTPLTKKPDINGYILKNAVKFFYRLVRFEAMRQVVGKAGIVPSADEIKAQERQFLAGMNAGGVSFSKFSARLPKMQATLLKDRIFDEAAEVAYLQKWSTNSLTVVTDKEIDDGIRYVKKMNAELAELNATNRLRAAAARDEILKKGRYFADVAKEYSEGDPGQGKFWDTVELAEFDASNPLAKWLATANAGDISDPIEMEDGLCIVGVVSKEVGSSGELNGKDVDFYQLVRILFKIYDPIEELDSRKEIADAILDARRNESMQQLGKELMSKAVITFPSGQDIFRVKAKKAKGKGPKKPAKKAKQKAKPVNAEKENHK